MRGSSSAATPGHRRESGCDRTPVSPCSRSSMPLRRSVRAERHPAGSHAGLERNPPAICIRRFMPRARWGGAYAECRLVARLRCLRQSSGLSDPSWWVTRLSALIGNMEGRSAVDPLMPDDVGASDQAGGLAVEQIHSPDTPPARVPTCEDDPASGAPLVLRHTRSMITGRYAPRQRADTAAASNPGQPGTGPSTPEADQAVVHAFGGIASS